MLKNFMNTLKLNNEAKKEIEKILSLPEVEAILSREEGKGIASRNELIKRLEGLHKKHTKNIEETSKVAAAAYHRVDQLETELLIAKSAKAQAAQMAYGATLNLQKEAVDITKELQEGRDRRLDPLYIELEKLSNFAACSLKFHHIMRGPRVVREDSNVEDVKAATEAIDSAKIELENLAISALTHSEISEEIKRVCKSLEAPLLKLELGAPYLDKDGEVKSFPANTGVDRRGRLLQR